MLYLHQSQSQTDLYELKVRELFHVLRSSYPKEEMDLFLLSFHCHNQGFRAQVFKHHLDCNTVEELADKMKISMSTFKRRFKLEFNAAPLQWMNEERAKHIYEDLGEGQLSLQEIANRYHFSSLSYLCKFCKRMFGTSPLELRKKIAEERDNLLQ